MNTNKLTSASNLQYSGLVLLVFAIIYYIIQTNTYCSSKVHLCKKPILSDFVNTENINPRMSEFGITQHVKCDTFPSTDVNVYAKITNIQISIFAFTFTGIIVLFILFRDYVPKGTILDVRPGSNDEMHDFMIYGIIIIAFYMGSLNYLRKGYEVISIWTLVILFVLTCGIAIIFSNLDNPHIENQAKYIMLICVGIIIIVGSNYKYINNLQIGNAFISTTAIFTLITEIIIAVLMGITIYNNYKTLSATPIQLSIYIFILLSIIVQIYMFAKHIYNCIWKTYTCEPQIETKQSQNSIKIDINCVAKFKDDSNTLVFVILAILFIILPSDYFVNSMTKAIVLIQHKLLNSKQNIP